MAKQAANDQPADGAAPAEPADGGWSLDAAARETDDPLAACLVAITKIYERPFSAQALTAGLPLVEGRLTPGLAVRAAERADLSARVMRRRLAGISDLVLPAVLLLADRQACVLVARQGRDSVEVIFPDSGEGARTIPLAELERQYAGYAIFVQPQFRYDRRSAGFEAPAGKSWFWGTLARFWWVYAQVVVAATMVNLFAVALPLFIMNVYDRVVPNQATETLGVLASGIVVVYLFDFLMRTLRGYFVDVAGRGADVLLASRIFAHVLGIKMAHRPASAGAFANNVKEFEALRDFFTSATIVAVVDVPFVALFIAVVAFIGGPVAWVLVAAVPAVLLVGLLLQIPLDRVVRRTFRESAQKHAILVEALGGLETIKGLAAEGRAQRAYEEMVGLTAQSGLKARLLSALAVNFSASVQSLVTVAVIVVGVLLINAGDLTIGALVACTMLSSRAMAPLGQIAGLLTRYNQSMASLGALNRIMGLPLDRSDGQRFLNRPTIEGEVEFRDVTFHYPEQEIAALNNVSFRIGAGERVGIIGRIGSGKSTVVRLILGLYEPSEGSVLVDGTDMRQIDPADLRRAAGFVPQDVYLFYGTVRENIAYGAPHAEDEAILRAARLAGVDEFTSQHPRGLDLIVGERGESLSGGQRQAIAVARALLLDPPLIMLDEPTSAMDNATEQRFLRRMAEARAGRTVIVVTHRSSMLALVDRLIVLDAGRVVADGPKDKVLQSLAQGRLRAAEGQEGGAG